MRLKETERVLWQLLTASTEKDLATAFTEDSICQVPESLAISTLATTEEKRSAIAFWEQFPLQNPVDVQTWMESLDPISNSEGLLFQNSMSGEELSQDPQRVAEDLDTEYSDSGIAVQHDSQSGIHAPVPASLSHYDTSAGQHALPSIPTGLQHSQLDTSSKQQSDKDPVSSGRGAAARRFGLSKEFQDMFLW
ncbi:uncharacterized protein A1O9_12334 [Exophiala aquamarina CBS 119918]|uniref:Uncharacterized protein n=1 Tax=Exophiala aquamarina CBS 119918 TaxID=1182545 RepID=A0A072NUZ3_9EURO|nr:uncharacterized protein A1O9_12334 [Exophiala aquamarina CBS 119918]KEF51699.1 hypothetical protein A1O9_12334 [Exophiala aquamarina CBS 119918]